MSALEAGDATFVRLKPTPPSLAYTCRKCRKPIIKWTAEINPITTKLHLTAHCHGDHAEFVVYLDMRGEVF